jgi:hypothetical protein
VRQGNYAVLARCSKHPDEALWRRFDLPLAFPSPKRKDLAAYGRRLATTLGITYPESLSERVRLSKFGNIDWESRDVESEIA